MKKLIALFLASVLFFALCGCNKASDSQMPSAGSSTDNSAASQKNSSGATSSGLDVDLTALSGTMVYAEVNNMLTNPDSYLGKTVRMKGNFSVYQGPNRNYYACLIADATACCSQGIEFVLDGDYTYPDDYPNVNSEITVTGTFDTYTEQGSLYCQLLNATLE